MIAERGLGVPRFLTPFTRRRNDRCAPSAPTSLQLSRALTVLTGLGLALGGVQALAWTVGLPPQETTPNWNALVIAGLSLSGGSAMVAAWAMRPENAHGELGSARAVDLAWRTMAITALVVYVGMLLWGTLNPVNLPGDTSRTGGHQILLGYSMLAAGLAAAVFPARVRYLYVLALYPLSIAYLSKLHGGFSLEAVSAPTSLLVFNLVVLATVTLASNMGAQLDQAVAQLDQRNRAKARAHARLVAQRRADSYVHDRILSALSPVTVGVAEPDSLREAAKQALASLAPPQTDGPRTVSRLFLELEQSARKADSTADVSLQISVAESQQVLPDAVFESLRAATEEALRNSMEHANRRDNRPVKRTLLMSDVNGAVEITVADDGDNFCDLPAGAHTGDGQGIECSIIGRMHDVGGSGTVSNRSKGCREGVVVDIRWDPSLGIGLDRTGGLDPGFAISRVLQGTSVHLLALCIFLAEALLMTCESARYTSLLWPVAALLWQGGIALLLVFPWPQAHLPRWLVPATIATVGLSNLLVLFPISARGFPDYAAWSLGSGWLLCILILLRQGPWAAWTGMLVLGLTTSLWAAQSGQDPMVVVDLMLGQIIALTIWTFASWWSKVILTAIGENQLRSRNVEVLLLTTSAVESTLNQRLAEVSHRARPLLERLASIESLDPDTRMAATLLEGELRDEIRARLLCREDVVQAARTARERGVEVVLLDDHGASPIPDRVLDRVCARGIEALNGATGGRAVLRLLPPGRRYIATIVTDQETVAVDAPQ